MRFFSLPMYRFLLTLLLLASTSIGLAQTGTQQQRSDTPQMANLVVVVKSDRMLYLYRDGIMIEQYPVELGKNPVGPKRQQGDNKTPEGAYTLDWRNPESIFHRSIHVSYPGPSDVAAAEARGVDPGDLIMIHGEPDYDDRERTGDWTNGCIAVSNEAINDIWARVEDGTPIHIYP